MPKPRESRRGFLRRVVELYPNVFRADDSVLFCKICDVEIKGDQIFLVKQHLVTGKHKLAEVRKNQNTAGTSQSLLTQYQANTDTSSSSKLSAFNMGVTKMFVEANIPLYKISLDCVRAFIEEFTSFLAPSESALRLNYLPIMYESKMDKMRQLAANNYIWVSFDETTDVEQRYIINFIFGVLGVDEEKERSYLFSMAELERVNNVTVGEFFINSLSSLWPDGKEQRTLMQLLNVMDLIRFYLIENTGIKYDKVLFCVTDAGTQMKLAMRNMQSSLFPKMIHLTCLAHGTHRVAEFIRTKFENVDGWISAVKKVFRKVSNSLWCWC